MNDPWDVKSVLRAGQYVSCMKINGVPLLPPILSKDCRKEMMYYKLLATEVEKRISLLQPLLFESDSDSSDKTISPDIVDSDANEFDVNSEKSHSIDLVVFEKESTIKPQLSNIECVLDTVDNKLSPPNSPKSIKTLELTSNDNLSSNSCPSEEHEHDIPERDSDWTREQMKENTLKVETEKREETIKNDELKKNKEPFDSNLIVKEINRRPSKFQESKSFTGSLIDIHKETGKDHKFTGKLIRQRSYTVLTPCPQLLAHLEEQFLCTGVDLASISMSESKSRLYSPKKRRSWDLESAKMKWSHMAVELNKKNIQNNARSKTFITRPSSRKHKSFQQPTTRARSVDQERKYSLPNKFTKNAFTMPCKTSLSSLQNIAPREKITSKKKHESQYPQKKETGKTILSTPNKVPDPSLAEHPKVEEPAFCIREVYEKIQKQQLLQMASLVEKQKREQMLLQQLFDEQNKVLYKQIKTISPKSPIEIKQAWTDASPESDNGPVSLSQLINCSPQPDNHNHSDEPLSNKSSTENHNNSKSNDKSLLVKSPDTKLRMKTTANQDLTPDIGNVFQGDKGNKINSSANKINRLQTSPKHCALYNNSSHSDKEYEEPILTDRTNDTLADLNFTFTDDSANNENNSINKQIMKKLQNDMRIGKRPDSNGGSKNDSTPLSVMHARKITAAHNRQTVRRLFENRVPTPQEREAATRIVAYAKGFLVRRLLKTERVQETVQTIRDALLCALQLHQEREGIRGADVDLHRRLIQQITAACYNLHETFVTSTSSDRCAMIAADRCRRRALATRQHTPTIKRANNRPTDVMSQSHTGVFLASNKRTQPYPISMTQSNYETFSGADKSHPLSGATRSQSHRRRPWR